MEQFKISIVMATWNAAHTLQRALDSVFCQTFENVEILIADGGSTDGTLDIIRSITDKRLTWWCSEKDNGIYDAWNKALDHVSGEWVLFLGADDQLWNSLVLKKFSEMIKKAPRELDIVYGKVANTNSKGDVWELAGLSWDKTKINLEKRSQMMAHQGVFHNRRLFKRGERFDTSFKIAGDYDFLLRTLKGNESYFLENLIVAKMQCGGVGGGFNNLNGHMECMRARKKNMYGPTISTFNLAMRYFARKWLIKIFGINTAKTINNWGRWLVGKPQFPE